MLSCHDNIASLLIIVWGIEQPFIVTSVSLTHDQRHCLLPKTFRLRPDFANEMSTRQCAAAIFAAVECVMTQTSIPQDVHAG